MHIHLGVQHITPTDRRVVFLNYQLFQVFYFSSGRQTCGLTWKLLRTWIPDSMMKEEGRWSDDVVNGCWGRDSDLASRQPVVFTSE